ncbi:MAG: hypothetical protein CO119_07870 [Flavobacteriales bacterium CG_4_9_14_3_um_filter_40_17]|nr:MAG: hypothetical protein CO119_07870 [Flavobacteriales bacterium CG_4_9_14_3_um_filter_40_17]
MKNLILTSAFILVFAFQNTATANHRYSDYIEFTESNVSFYVYRDGTFDFKIHSYETPYRNRLYASISTPNFSFSYNQSRPDSRREYVRYDRYGNITQIGDVYIDYDGYGRLRAIGNVEIYFHGNYVSSIGHPRANYAYYKRYYRPHVYVAPRVVVYNTHYAKPYYGNHYKNHAYGNYANKGYNRGHYEEKGRKREDDRHENHDAGRDSHGKSYNKGHRD